MPGDWLAERRTEVAADRILDAAEQLYTQRDPASIGMNEIARAAGCSRATLYRYFENREALRTAYVHREAYRLSREIKRRIDGVDEPRERLIASIAVTLRMVRESPALASWFAITRRPDRRRDSRTLRGDHGLGRSVRQFARRRRPRHHRTPRPLGGAGDHFAVDVPGPGRSRRAGDDRGVRGPDRDARLPASRVAVNSALEAISRPRAGGRRPTEKCPMREGCVFPSKLPISGPDWRYVMAYRSSVDGRWVHMSLGGEKAAWEPVRGDSALRPSAAIARIDAGDAVAAVRPVEEGL